jgi:hypothetical protein
MTILDWPRAKQALRAVALAAAAATTLTAGEIVTGAANADATTFTFPTMNDSGGIYWRSAPDWNTAIAQSGYGVYPDTYITVSCYQLGAANVPGSSNAMWVQAAWASGSGRGSGWINEHFVNDGAPINQAAAGVPACGSSGSSGGSSGGGTTTSPTYINGVNVGYPQNDWHVWGYCTVRDYDGGPYGHVIVSNTAGLHVVRNGMLWGWFDNGGGPGWMRCPTTDEYGYMNGVRQNFQSGAEYWVSGMDHAAAIDLSREAALQWAWNCQPNGACYYKGSVANYYHYCLGFAYDAYLKAGKDITYKMPYGPSHNTAWTYWKYAANRQPTSLTPPRGALVFWDDRVSPDGAGHVALSLGGGWVISTAFGGNSLIHTFRIADFPNYLVGWTMP